MLMGSAEPYSVVTIDFLTSGLVYIMLSSIYIHTLDDPFFVK